MSGKPLCPHCGCTEDERGQVRREALEEAASLFQPRAIFQSRRGGEIVVGREAEQAIADAIRTLADRSEPRQEKEGDRG